MTTRIAIDIPDQRAEVYRLMAARCHQIEIVEQESEFDALITNNADAVVTGNNEISYLLVDPFDCGDDVRRAIAARSNAFAACPHRYTPEMIEMKRAVESGKVGIPGLLRVHRWEVDFDTCANALPAEIDTALWLIGQPVSTVFGLAQSDYSQVHLGFDGGAMAMIDIHRSMPSGNRYLSASLIGASGAIYSDDHDNAHWLLKSTGTRAFTKPPSDLSLFFMIDDFVAAIQGEEHGCPDWEQLDDAANVVGDVHQSIQGQRAVGGVA